MTMVSILVKQNCKFIPNYLPSQAHAGDAGWDLRADIKEPLSIYAGSGVKVATGLYVALPPSTEDDLPFIWEMQIRSRSGLAKRGLIVANSPGTVDAGYRGEIGILLANISDEVIVIHSGDKIAQAVIALAAMPNWVTVEALPESSRGTGGFGSSGK